MLKSLKEMNSTQMTGLMLLVGIVVIFLSGIFTPGVLIIDFATGSEPADVENAIRAKVDNPHATAITAVFYLIGHILILGGIVALWPRQGGGSGSDAVRRAGVLAIAVSFICGIASAVLDIAIVIGDRVGQSSGFTLEEYWPSVQNFHYFDAAVQGMLLLTLFPGIALLGCSLSDKLTGRRKTAAQGVALISFVALILMFIGILADGAEAVAAIASLAIFPITAWIIALGTSVYKEDEAIVG